ncbi:hypothetical protein D8B26_001368 [Coccidioides posadasii str. Silveira]|uniref:uncharacterized protein n=1 Tax=Coccidioides posadasii (strain RMSCC 757 / Silveira) TaxID=443226 RepID=UPI001BED6ED0|nr:hypothetical protein D8B26_001368 [Coccidioides posadasii str. Silveira]
MLTRRNELRSRPAAMPVAALLNMLLHLAFRLASTSILKALPICVASGLNALICVDPFWRLEPAEVVSAVERPSLGQKSIFEIHQIFGGGGGGGGKVVSGQRMRKPDSFDLPSNLVSGNTPLWSWCALWPH